FVERKVAVDGVANPALEDPDALIAHRLFFITQEIGPLERPEVGEFREPNQPVDERVALGWRGIVQGRPRFAWRGEAPDGIKVSPSQKNGVDGDLRGIDPERFKLRKNVPVNGALRGGIAPHKVRPIREEREPANAPAAEVADGDGGLD